jgi:hypothetical protein
MRCNRRKSSTIGSVDAAITDDSEGVASVIKLCSVAAVVLAISLQAISASASPTNEGTVVRLVDGKLHVGDDRASRTDSVITTLTARSADLFRTNTYDRVRLQPLPANCSDERRQTLLPSRSAMPHLGYGNPHLCRLP